MSIHDVGYANIGINGKEQVCDWTGLFNSYRIRLVYTSKNDCVLSLHNIIVRASRYSRFQSINNIGIKREALYSESYPMDASRLYRDVTVINKKK
jgi:hypothetical protein